jgi:hypothetical protein
MSLSVLEKWYACQCNGEWEHGYGVRIETLDNPGWRVRIGLHGTEKQSAALTRVTLTRSEDDWLSYWVENEIFEVACGPENLSEAIDTFAGWFESD